MLINGECGRCLDSRILSFRRQIGCFIKCVVLLSWLHVTVSLNRTPDFNDSLWFGQCFTWFCSIPEVSVYVCTNAANYILMLFIIFPV